MTLRRLMALTADTAAVTLTLIGAVFATGVVVWQGAESVARLIA